MILSLSYQPDNILQVGLTQGRYQPISGLMSPNALDAKTEFD
jgi:hypothetical protein